MNRDIIIDLNIFFSITKINTCIFVSNKMVQAGIGARFFFIGLHKPFTITHNEHKKADSASTKIFSY